MSREKKGLIMRKLLLLSFLVATGFQLKAQTTIFTETKDANHVFRTGKAPVGNLTHSNNIIQAFADALNVSTSTIEYFLNYQQEIRITKQGTHTYETRVGLNNIYIGGDDNYNSFDLKEYLKPRTVDIELALLNRENQATGKKFLFSLDIKNTDNRSSVQTFTDNDSMGLSGYRLSVSSVVFHYTNNDVEEFKAQIGRISNYYVYKRQLPYWNDTLNKMDFTQVDKIEEIEKNLKIMKQRQKEVRDQNLRNYLKQDPDYIYRKLDDFIDLVDRKDREYTEAMKNLHVLYYDEGQKQKNLGNKDRALYYFGKSIETKRSYEPPHMQVAKIMFEREEYDSATTELKTVSSSNDGIIKAEVKTLAKQLYDKRVAMAKQDKAAKKYEEALLNYSKAEELCGMTNVAGCVSDIQPDIKDTKIKGFNYLLDLANKSLANRKLADAENKAMEAAAFASKYPETYPNATAPRELIDKVKGEYYKQHIADAKDLMIKKYYAEALDKLEIAEDLERNYNFKTDKTLRDLQVQAAENVAVDMCEETIHLAEKNEMSKAFKNQRKVKDLIKKYNLESKKRVSLATAKMDEIVLQQDCINSEEFYKETIGKFKAQAKEANFIEAFNTWDYAIRMATVDKEYCAIDTTGAAALKLPYKAGYAYQTAIEKARGMIGQADNRTVIDLVAEANTELYTEEVQALGTRRVGLGSIALNSGNMEFMADATDYLAKNKEPEDALLLADKLQIAGYNEDRLKPLLFEVGEGLAKQDYKTKKNQKWRPLAKSYYAHNKKLKYLKKGYKKAWKKMKRR